MKILTIDDQVLILKAVSKKLTDVGYDVKTVSNAKEGVEAFKTFKPDLVTVDINMPGYTGLQCIQTIKELDKNVPIIVMSGMTDEETILAAFELGIDDFMKKPGSLDELAARIRRQLHTKFPLSSFDSKKGTTQMVQKRAVGIVIPCYNEAERLSGKAFQIFAHSNLGYQLCFVNDGSTDNTLEVLRELQKGNEETIEIYNCERNGGKAEAVRQGMLHLAKKADLEYVGYLDADLSTDFSDYENLIQTLDGSNFKIVSGSRMHRMGADIARDSARQIISKSINMIIQRILSMPFKDTQCGAKVMTKDTADLVFEKPFRTKWLFDVEIFMRMRSAFGKEQAKAMICEQPLKRWVHMDGSKLSFKDSLKIFFQLSKIAFAYNR
ncbi:MAG: response regulator [Leeuwenhoekiella sp.]